MVSAELYFHESLVIEGVSYEAGKKQRVPAHLVHRLTTTGIASREAPSKKSAARDKKLSPKKAATKVESDERGDTGGGEEGVSGRG